MRGVDVLLLNEWPAHIAYGTPPQPGGKVLANLVEKMVKLTRRDPNFSFHQITLIWSDRLIIKHYSSPEITYDQKPRYLFSYSQEDYFERDPFRYEAGQGETHVTRFISLGALDNSKKARVNYLTLN